MSKTLTKEVSVEEAGKHLHTLIDEIREQGIEVVVKESGTPVARILPPVSPREQIRQEFVEEAEELRRKFADMPPHELEDLIDRAIRDVRAQRKKKARSG
jgi:antitoxin (DNA-binding transcriptional repressor) of toxin-antitoxin stability system